jgi:hypothetical protein
MGQFRCCKIQNFLLILDLKKYFRESAPEKSYVPKPFFRGPWIFWRNSFFSYFVYSAQFLKYFLGSEINLKHKYFDAHVDLCREAEDVNSFVIFYMKI